MLDSQMHLSKLVICDSSYFPWITNLHSFVPTYVYATLKSLNFEEIKR